MPETDYREELYGPEFKVCNGVWRSDAPEGDPHDYVEHRCNLSGRHTEPHTCKCEATLAFNLPGPPQLLYGVPVVAASGNGRVMHVANGNGKTLCGKFFAQKPGTLEKVCPICAPHRNQHITV